MRIVWILVLVVAGWMIWKNLAIPKSVGLVDGQLHPCPRSPNCVSCQISDTKHYIAPLPLIPGKSLDFIEQFLKEHYDTEVIVQTPVYMHVVVTTKICRFKDDLEFLVDESKQEICVRSASRIGYGDGGINRARIEAIRNAMPQS